MAEENTEQTKWDERTAQKKKEFIAAFEKSMGIITSACARADISRQTYYNWMDSDDEFAEQIASLDRNLRDQVQDRLLAGVVDNNMTAIIFYLKNKHPDYKPQIELSGEVGVLQKYESLTSEDIAHKLAETAELIKELQNEDGNSGEATD